MIVEYAKNKHILYYISFILQILCDSIYKLNKLERQAIEIIICQLINRWCSWFMARKKIISSFQVSKFNIDYIKEKEKEKAITIII